MLFVKFGYFLGCNHNIFWITYHKCKKGGFILASNALIKKRRDDICKLLKERNILSISELSSILNISKITVRRDLDYLAKEKRIKKTHGGAIIESTKDYEPPYMIRSLKMIEQKKAIGKFAASLVPESSLIFIDVGTTLL